MNQLSETAQKLLDFLRAEYIEDGYMYSGSWPYTSLKERGFLMEDIAELQAAGLVQQRNCVDFAFELSPAERGELITKNSLCSVWYEKTGDGLFLSIQDEVRSAANISYNQDTGLMTVNAVKLVGDYDKPDKIDISSPFAAGQVIDVEYDLPRGKSAFSRKQTGQFMVTNVIHNLLMNPGKNMLELQSLSAEFNKLHPNSRTMLLFEDVVLSRMKRPLKPLDHQIQNAKSKTQSTSGHTQIRRSSNERI